jgi:hypothetical protein
LFAERPIETVMPIDVSTRRANLARLCAGDRPCSRSVPDRSRNASSIESGSTSGVSSSISIRTSRPMRTYFSISGGMTIAEGQSVSALNIGIADFTP